jgi:DNA-binding MarR family transcriptional regulator
MTTQSLLDEDEAARWTAWKRAGDTVQAAVAREIQAAADLSVPDFAVLSRVIEEGGETGLGQQELASMLGWQRARLSRQLGRMAGRGLLGRVPAAGNRRLVTATGAGRAALARARPAHARAVRAALFDRLPPAAARDFWAALTTLADPTRPDPTRPDPTRPEPTRADPSRPEPTGRDPGGADLT